MATITTDELFTETKRTISTEELFSNVDNDKESSVSNVSSNIFKEKTQATEYSVFTSDEIKDLKAKGPIKFAESALRFTDVKKSIPIVGAVSDVASSAAMLAKVNKLKTGKYDNEIDRQKDQKAVIDYARSIEEQKIRGFSIGAKVFQGAIQIPATMVDFLVTAGLAKGTVMAGTKVVGIGAQTGVKALALKAGQAAATVAVGGALSPQYYVPKIGETKINDMMAITDKGEAILEMGKEKPSISIAKAYFGACTQFGTELVGGSVLNKALTPIKGVAGKGLSKVIGQEIADKFVSGIAKLNSKLTNKATEKFLNAASYHGLVEEIGEEYMNKYVNAFFGLEDLTGQDDRPMFQRVAEATGNAEEFFTTAGIIAAGSLLTKGAVKVISNNTKLFEQHLKDKGLSKEEIKTVIDNTTESEKEAELEKVYDVQTEVVESPEVDAIVEKVISEIQPKTQIEQQAIEAQPQETVSRETLKDIPESERPLYEEALKYDSAEEFVSKKNTPEQGKIYLYRGLEKKFDPKYDATTTDAPNGYSTWTDNPELARQYAGEKGYIYKIELPADMQGQELIDEDGERALFIDNEKKAGLNNINGKEYLVYTGHDDYSNNLISETKTQQEYTDIYNKAQELKTQAQATEPSKTEEKQSIEPVKPKSVNAEIVEKPVEKKQSRVLQRAIETFNELANVTGQEYDVKNNVDQMAKAEMLYEQNPDVAERIANGRQKAPEGMLSTAVNIYYTQKMLEEKQYEKAEKALRQSSLQQTLRGQEIQIETKRATNLNDPQLFIQDVINKKLDLAGTKLYTSKDKSIKGEKKSPKRAIAERITQDIKVAETEIEKQQLSDEDFINILKELSC